MCALINPQISSINSEPLFLMSAAFFFLLDFPVKQERKGCSKSNNSGYNSDFFPLTYHYSTKNLTSHFKFQSHSKSPQIGRASCRERV